MRARNKGLKRREFFEVGLTAAAAGTLAACSRAGGGDYWRFFTAHEARTVDAICEQIIPADDDPGAAQAEVVKFIDRQLTGHYSRHQAAYRAGLARVDEASGAKFGKRFVELAFDEQTEVLLELEQNDREFFGLLRDHTMQGFYGDPRHGGNRDAVSWKMLELPFPPVRGRWHYTQEAG